MRGKTIEPKEEKNSIRDCSLITGRGATKREEGGMWNFTPTNKRGGDVLAMLKQGGGHNKF